MMSPNPRLLPMLLIAAVVLAGCGTPSQPWAGQPYQPPGSQGNPARQMFMPRPAILPGRRAERVDSATQDADIERMLFGESTSGSDESNGIPDVGF